MEHWWTAVDGRALRGLALCLLAGAGPAVAADVGAPISLSFSSWLPIVLAAVFALALYGLVVHRLVTQLRASREQIAHTDALTQSRLVLAQEKDRLSMILRSIGEAVIVTDKDGKVQYLNPTAENLLGWNSAGATGMPLSAIFRVLDDAGAVLDPVRQCVEQGDTILASGTLKRVDGKEFAVEHSGGPIRDAGNHISGVVLSLRDVTETRHLARQLSYQASHDALTGLLNRREFEARLENALRTAEEADRRHVLCYMDLDQFKVVNDSCGHIAGDQLLKQITGLIKSLIRDNDTLARLGGDEFGILLEGCSVEKASLLADAIHKMIDEFRFVWGERSFKIGASIGIAEICADSGNVTDVLSAADAACYLAKDLGRNCTYIRRADDADRSKENGVVVWAERLSAAIREQRLQLYAQPVKSLQRGEPTQRYEVLVRMLDEGGQLVPPQAFIPAAERYSLMSSVDRWVISTALRRWKELPSEWGNEHSCCLLNISAHSLNDLRFPDFIASEIRESGVAPRHVAFEVSENIAVANMTQTRTFVARVRAMGCRFGLDDFGVGLSSFAYLKNLNVDYVKIDGNFVRHLTNDPIDYAVVESINQLGHVMGIETIAEYVENEAILDGLTAMGVDYAQGYVVGQPLPLAEALSSAVRAHMVQPSGLAEGVLQQHAFTPDPYSFNRR